jgi:hypothetical protein
MRSLMLATEAQGGMSGLLSHPRRVGLARLEIGLETGVGHGSSFRSVWRVWQVRPWRPSTPPKHANATGVQVTAEHHDATLSVTVEDDGTGGATLSLGGGLAGLSDRVTALGGRLTMHSPTGAGTRLTAELPCA